MQRYEGGNEIIDRLHDGSQAIWLVNGAVGRRVLLLPLDSTAADAQDAYEKRFGNRWRGSSAA